MLFHHHTWSEWHDGYGNNHPWQHVKMLERFCMKCGEVDYQLIELMCSTKKRTGEYCHWCKPYAESWEKYIKSLSFDKSLTGEYTPNMNPQKYNLAFWPNKADKTRNKKIFDLIEDGELVTRVAQKYHLSRQRVYQIYRTMKNKKPA